MVTLFFSNFNFQRCRFFVFSVFLSPNDPLACHREITLLRREIIVRQTYRTDTKFIKDMPSLSNKGRYAKSAMSVVRRDIRSGLFTTLKAATLIIIEDEIGNELSAHDMCQAQLHELSDDSSDVGRNGCIALHYYVHFLRIFSFVTRGIESEGVGARSVRSRLRLCNAQPAGIYVCHWSYPLNHSGSLVLWDEMGA